MGAPRFNADTLPPAMLARMSPEARAALGLQTKAEHFAAHQPKREDHAERELQKLCEQELSLRGIETLHLSYRAREKKGWPDLTFALPHRPIVVELKSATGKLENDQVRVLTRMAANGWEVYVIRDFDRFRDLLDGKELNEERFPQ